MDKEVTISINFQKQVKDLDIINHVMHANKKSSSGEIKKLAQDLYSLHDDNGEAVCGFVDAKTFYEALCQSDVAQLFCGSGNQLN